MMMDFCVELSYSFMLDDAKLDEIASQGVTAISAPYDIVESASKKTLRERAAALSSRNIKVLTAHPRFGSFNSDNCLVNQYDAQRKLYLEQLKEGFERMSALGVKTAPLHTGGACLPPSPEWAFEMCAESIGEILPEAESAGIVLAIENTFYNHPQKWDGGYGQNERPPGNAMYVYDDMEKICALIDGFNSKYVMGCYDLGHAHYLGDVKKDHDRMGDRIYLYHLHDNNKARDMHLPPGYGTLDWGLFGLLFNANRSDFVTYIEADPWTPGKYGNMIRETKALMSGAGKINGENIYRRCLTCGHLILEDEKGGFCCCLECFT